MNEEELAALAEKLYAAGMTDKDVAMHLDRAIMGQQPENETNVPQAFSIHALDAITDYSGSKPSSSGASRGGGRAHIDADDYQNRQAWSDLMDQASGEHPKASMAGIAAGVFGPAVPELATDAAQAVATGGRSLYGAGRTALDAGKAIGKGLVRETRIGRGVSRGLREIQAARAAGQGEAAAVDGLTGLNPERALDVPPVPVREPTPGVTLDDIRELLKQERAAGQAPSSASAPTYPKVSPAPSSAPSKTVTVGTKASVKGGKLKAAKSVLDGTGETLPYYPRGGKAEQAMAPFPTSSPTVATKLGDLKTEIAAARAFGNTDEQIAKALAKRGISAPEVRKAMGA